MLESRTYRSDDRTLANGLKRNAAAAPAEREDGRTESDELSQRSGGGASS